VNILEAEIKTRVSASSITLDPFVGFNNLFNLVVNEVVIRVNVLFDQSSKTQKCRHEFPFFLD
jgi:hypothetical protein